jgi:periplasmic divalent cation tolerance protein
MTDAIQVVTTVADQADAKRIAAALVAQRLAACVQVSGPIESTYRWKDQIEKSQEWVCAIKTQHVLFPEVEAAIRELHSYDEPEIIALPIIAGSQGYLDWIAESVTSPASSTDALASQ